DPAEQDIDRRAGAADLAVPGNQRGTAAGAFPHGEPETDMDHARAVLEIARGADDHGLAVAARLLRRERLERPRGEDFSRLDRKPDELAEIVDRRPAELRIAQYPASGHAPAG